MHWELNKQVVPSASLKQLQTSPDPISSIPSLEYDDTDVKLSVDLATELTPDLIGLFTLTLPVSPGSDLVLLSSLQDDISWFDTPVSIMCMENSEVVDVPLIEVKLRDKEMAMAVLTGLKHKYSGLEGDTTGSHADILPDKETGMYTLSFTDIKKKRYKGTMEKFREYSKQLPFISRGLGAEQVFVGFHANDQLEVKYDPEWHDVLEPAQLKELEASGSYFISSEADMCHLPSDFSSLPQLVHKLGEMYELEHEESDGARAVVKELLNLTVHSNASSSKILSSASWLVGGGKHGGARSNSGRKVSQSPSVKSVDWKVYKKFSKK